ncbi:hypothetical protein HYC85_009713 [Camellia sinensis]|uniref:Protein kinase domain-containing protein n=1 Tax=Camellia sinensis TaxID=4442 RepID=A0A7J7HGF4_CAMSI|nr:hypothetical protein HYC85_009713 [Camellia sinensis]
MDLELFVFFDQRALGLKPGLSILLHSLTRTVCAFSLQKCSLEGCCKSLERWTKKNRSNLLQVYQRQMSKEGLQKVIQQEQTDKAKDQEMTPAVIEGNDQVTGHIISTTIGGKNGEPKRTISYMAERVVGTGSFGIVFQAKCLETGETMAIKKVLQDRRYKNRELQLMRLMDHPNVVSLKHCFFSTTSKDELFLNLVMEYVPETMYRVLKHYSNANQRMPLIYVKLYTYQIFRGLAYIHTVPGVCHRDVKPQNLLVDPLTHQVKLCDFGSAKVLVKDYDAENYKLYEEVGGVSATVHRALCIPLC